MTNDDMGTSEGATGAQIAIHESGPDPDGGVEMTDAEWDMFRGATTVTLSAGELGARIRGVLARTGVPSEVALREWADEADALESERDQWRESAEFAAERLDHVQAIAALDTTPLLTATQLRQAVDGAM